MRLQVKARNLEISESLRAYAESKLSKLERHLHDSDQVELELIEERNPSIAANQVAEATVWSKGPTVHAREASQDMKASIDQLVGKLERQVRRKREKRRSRFTRFARRDSGVVPGRPLQDEDEPTLGKTKTFPLKPMTPEEAVLQLELVGHDFYVFRNADSGEVNVVYRRRAGNYGLIEPQT